MEQRNKSKLIIGACLIIFGGALLAWSLMGREARAPESESTSGSSTNTSQSSDDSNLADNPDQAVSGEAEEATIVFTSDGFSPEELEVKLGTVVTVKNESNQRVQFSSDDHPTHRLNEGMNLRTLSPGESDTFTAGPVGTHGFHDHIDARFTGVITVTE